ncbi:hypothetical protein MCOR27_006713 [Pyricularia oryzae]|uniref:DUF8035 domain-containing protein n=1 Tax=Pyricularia grisea TaxID=148305 RepID=A0ABQ8NZP5_PYRGI|nr:hypothetical protein MCOR01_009621 [Pyricularia oryzae]KAI6303897.1 hypothetical protein MCOR33_001065 [Pyricularia grisea]KAH9437110.1 hypothetical protein MCOR02_000765 [Pyricularia oryzae]KAI6255913.1 hypothetical protein MCOR19_007595 [Pyricularia oryzae]KAI6274629.1 hypothetical protein MCOR26_006380 [Pyricularia oryzae]
MSHRDRDIYDDRESYYSTGPRRSRAGSDTDLYERFQEVRRDDRRMPVRERDRDNDSDSRLPSFMRRDESRRPAESSGPLVLRQREVETVTRPQPRSPSQVRFQEERSYIRRTRSPSRSPSPPPARDRIDIRETRIMEQNRRSPSVERIRSATRIVKREQEREPSPVRIVRRGRSPSVERERIRIIERSRSRERLPSPSPSPPPPPPVPEVIRAPTIEREVITHYKNIDHGTIHLPKPRSPPPPPRPILKQTRDYEVTTTRDTEIDISRSRDRTEVDIHERRRRSVSRDRGALVVARPRSPSPPPRVVETERERKIRVDIDNNSRHRSTSISAEFRKGHGHTHSLPPARRPDYSEESDRITSRIDSRGRMGEAWNGSTRDWTIVDVPPGTERVRMDGVGGGAAEVTWQRYNGVRRAKFIPERDRDDDSYTSVSDRDRTETRTESDRLAVEIRDKRTTDVEIEQTTRRRSRRQDESMWTEITKDLVCREAIIDMGYEFEETDLFYYVMQYLKYEDVLRLVEVSDDIRRHRRRHLREIEWDREYRDVDYYRRSSRRRGDNYYDREFEVDVDREVVYDRRPRGYIR